MVEGNCYGTLFKFLALVVIVCWPVISRVPLILVLRPPQLTERKGRSVSSMDEASASHGRTDFPHTVIVEMDVFFQQYSGHCSQLLDAQRSP